MSIDLSVRWSVSARQELFYTDSSAKVLSSPLGSGLLFSWCSGDIAIVNIHTGTIRAKIESEEEDEFTTFAVDPKEQFVITATRRSLLMQVWDISAIHNNHHSNHTVSSTSSSSSSTSTSTSTPTPSSLSTYVHQFPLLATWKAGRLPILDLSIDSSSQYLVSCSSDKIVRVWAIQRNGVITHQFKGHNNRVVKVHFYKKYVISCSEEGEVRVWDLMQTDQTKCKILNNHISTVTDVVFICLFACSFISSSLSFITLLSLCVCV